MKITDVAISVIANPHSEMVSAGVKGGVTGLMKTAALCEAFEPNFVILSRERSEMSKDDRIA